MQDEFAAHAAKLAGEMRLESSEQSAEVHAKLFVQTRVKKDLVVVFVYSGKKNVTQRL